jgi:hypothetical protein
VEYDEDGNPIDPTAADEAGLTDEAKPADEAGLTDEAKPADEEVLPIGVGALHDWERWGEFENKKVAWVGDYEVNEEKIAFSIDSMLCSLDRKLTGSGCDAKGSY